MQFRLSFFPLSFSRSFSLPLSSLDADDPATEPAREVSGARGGDPDARLAVLNGPGAALLPFLVRPVSLGNARRYHPPVNVSATSWYSVASASGDAAASSAGALIHPTAQRSSSGASTAAAALRADAESEMCADCTGMRYCAYDHSDSKYFGSGRKGASGENVLCRFLHMGKGSQNQVA